MFAWRENGKSAIGKLADNLQVIIMRTDRFSHLAIERTISLLACEGRFVKVKSGKFAASLPEDNGTMVATF